jgi:hypothetical protein
MTFRIRWWPGVLEAGSYLLNGSIRRATPK